MEQDLKWNFFATSHGKGVVDGLGGTVKRSVWRYVRSGKGNAATLMSFYKTAVERNPGMRVEFISKDAIEEKWEILEARWPSILPIPNTRKIHYVVPMGGHHLLVSDTSDSTECKQVRIKDQDEIEFSDSLESLNETMDESQDNLSGNEELEVQIGDWVLVTYDGKNFPGELVEIGEYSSDELKVNVMHPSGGHWRWPQPADKIFYYIKDIIRKIDRHWKQRTVYLFFFVDFLYCCLCRGPKQQNFTLFRSIIIFCIV